MLNLTPKTTGSTKFLLGHCDSTQSFTEKKTDLLQWRPLSPLRYWISLMHLLETQHG